MSVKVSGHNLLSYRRLLTPTKPRSIINPLKKGLEAVSQYYRPTPTIVSSWGMTPPKTDTKDVLKKIVKPIAQYWHPKPTVDEGNHSESPVHEANWEAFWADCPPRDFEMEIQVSQLVARHMRLPLLEQPGDIAVHDDMIRILGFNGEMLVAHRFFDFEITHGME
jgi:hypothetical protein